MTLLFALSLNLGTCVFRPLGWIGSTSWRACTSGADSREGTISPDIDHSGSVQSSKRTSSAVDTAFPNRVDVFPQTTVSSPFRFELSVAWFLSTPPRRGDMAPRSGRFFGTFRRHGYLRDRRFLFGKATCLRRDLLSADTARHTLPKRPSVLSGP